MLAAAHPFALLARRVMADHVLSAFLFVVPLLCLLGYLVTIYIPALLVGILLAFILDGLVNQISRRFCPRIVAITAVLAVLITSLSLLVLIGIPHLSVQVGNFSEQLLEYLPQLQKKIDDWLGTLPVWLSGPINGKMVMNNAMDIIGNIGKTILGSTFANVAGLFSLIVYSVLMPLLIFFLLRDKDKIFSWLRRFLPQSSMLTYLGEGLNEQFGAYVRGKLIESLVVFTLCLVAFTVFKLNYSFTLAVAVGLSVIIPFVGAVAVTFPVVIAAAIQFGLEVDFWWIVGLYAIIQAFDGQLLVPLLFSEVVKIHPAAILIAILCFGTIWGVWGVFFAIPLASLIKVLLLAVEKRWREKKPPATPQAS